MRQINKDNIINAINEYIASTPKHPLLVWFHSDIDIDDVRRNIENISGCATCGGAIYADKEGAIQTITPSETDEDFILPGTYNESTKFFLFHRYTEQLEPPFLQYAVDLMNETKLPVIYVANDYSKEEEKQLDVSAFEEWEYESNEQ